MEWAIYTDLSRNFDLKRACSEQWISIDLSVRVCVHVSVCACVCACAVQDFDCNSEFSFGQNSRDQRRITGNSLDKAV